MLSHPPPYAFPSTSHRPIDLEPAPHRVHQHPQSHVQANGNGYPGEPETAQHFSGFIPSGSVTTSFNHPMEGVTILQSSDMFDQRIKHRRRTTQHQLKILEEHFEVTPKPDMSLRKELSNQLGMSAREVQVWFQNRRAKCKKLEKRAQAASEAREGTYAPPPASMSSSTSSMGIDSRAGTLSSMNMTPSMSSSSDLTATPLQHSGSLGGTPGGSSSASLVDDDLGFTSLNSSPTREPTFLYSGAPPPERRASSSLPTTSPPGTLASTYSSMTLGVPAQWDNLNYRRGSSPAVLGMGMGLGVSGVTGEQGPYGTTGGGSYNAPAYLHRQQQQQYRASSLGPGHNRPTPFPLWQGSGPYPGLAPSTATLRTSGSQQPPNSDYTFPTEPMARPPDEAREVGTVGTSYLPQLSTSENLQLSTNPSPSSDSTLFTFPSVSSSDDSASAQTAVDPFQFPFDSMAIVSDGSSLSGSSLGGQSALFPADFDPSRRASCPPEFISSFGNVTLAPDQTGSLKTMADDGLYDFVLGGKPTDASMLGFDGLRANLFDNGSRSSLTPTASGVVASATSNSSGSSSSSPSAQPQSVPGSMRNGGEDGMENLVQTGDRFSHDAHLNRLAEAYPDVPLSLLSAAPHPSVAMWRDPFGRRASTSALDPIQEQPSNGTAAESGNVLVEGSGFIRPTPRKTRSTMSIHHNPYGLVNPVSPPPTSGASPTAFINPNSAPYSSAPPFDFPSPFSFPQNVPGLPNAAVSNPKVIAQGRRSSLGGSSSLDAMFASTPITIAKSLTKEGEASSPQRSDSLSSVQLHAEAYKTVMSSPSR